jgi:UTP--glucose-1-phosphate uridylyltransferase
MNIRKAVITAAGPAHRTLPLQTLVDRDGQSRSCLEILVTEALESGIDQVCIVVAPGDAPKYTSAAGNLAGQLTFVEQPKQLGYGDALLRAKEFIAGQPFLHMISDHLYHAVGTKRCAQQLIETASRENCSVSAVQPTRESLLPYYGTIGGRRVFGNEGLYEIEKVIEKPTPTEAEQSLIVPGLRAGHYLCFFGMHVLTPAVMDALSQLLSKPAAKAITLSDAISTLAARERFLAQEVRGTRFNIGIKFGLLYAQLALALDSADREDVLANLVELLAGRPRQA